VTETANFELKKKKVIGFLLINNHLLIVYGDGDYWIDKGNKENF
jgi:hypothetical protein